MSLAAIIIYERKSKGFTQEDLAELAGITLRTIQRVEKGESIPRGYTLKALANALDLPVETLYAATITPTPIPQEAAATKATTAITEEDTLTTLQFLNLSCLAYLVIPFGNIILPAWLWRRKRHLPTINEVGKKIINYQLLWSVLLSALLLIVVIVQVCATYYWRQPPGISLFIVFIIVHISNIPVILHASWQIKKSNYNVYNIRWRVI